MTVNIPIPSRGATRARTPFEHEGVCLRCGHGESLHPQRELGCVVCDDRAHIGLPSRFCVGFLADCPVSPRAPAGVH